MSPINLSPCLPLRLYSFSPPFSLLFQSHCPSISPSALLQPVSLCPCALALALALCPDLHSHSLPPAIFLPFELSLSCLFPLSRPLPVSQSRPSFSFSFSFSFSSGLYFSAPDVPPVANIVFLPPPLDMAKEAICALLAILEHFFEAFSFLDLFLALASFRPAPRLLPVFLHPVPSSIPTYSISRPSAQVNIIPAWFPSLSETSARAVFIFRASVA